MKSTATDFKSYCDDYLASVKTSRKTTSEFLQESSEFFGVTKMAISKRFKSYYKKCVSEKVEEITTPTRDELIVEIMKANSVSELWESLGLSANKRAGLFDKHFNVSTFEKAKAKCLLETFDVGLYDPSISENLSLVCSQVLGDGSYCRKRKALRISHGDKQFNYALWKASLFNKSFPTTKPAGTTNLLTHTQGHKYSSWYSGKLPSKVCEFVENNPPDVLMDELTPFGLLLYFLDDAYINLDTTKRGNTYVLIHIPFGDTAVEKMMMILKSYGIGSTKDKNNNVKIGTISGAVMFYKNFIEPFKDEIPSCMHYKTELKI